MITQCHRNKQIHHQGQWGYSIVKDDIWKERAEKIENTITFCQQRVLELIENPSNTVRNTDMRVLAGISGSTLLFVGVFYLIDI